MASTTNNSRHHTRNIYADDKQAELYKNFPADSFLGNAKTLDNFFQWVTFFRRNLNKFATDYLGIKLHLYQEVLLYLMGVSNFIGGLFAMNAVEVAFNSGFLFMIPQLTSNESSQYLFGMTQYALAFLVGRYLAGHFLKWFPQHNITAATLLSAVSGAASLGLTHNVYGLTTALFLAEVGISTAFTLAFARTAKNHLTQDRVTSLIMASAISCALGPWLLTQLAQELINTGIMSESGATIATLLAIPSALAFLSAKLFSKMEGKAKRSFSSYSKAAWAKIKAYMHK